MKGTCPFHGACVEGLVSSGALARRCEVPAEQLSSVPDSHSCWDTTAFYLAHLCAVLALTDAATRLGEGGVPDPVWDDAVAHLGTEGTVDVLFAIATINVWNRLAVTSRMQPPALAAGGGHG